MQIDGTIQEKVSGTERRKAENVLTWPVLGFVRVYVELTHNTAGDHMWRQLNYSASNASTHTDTQTLSDTGTVRTVRRGNRKHSFHYLNAWHRCRAALTNMRL